MGNNEILHSQQTDPGTDAGAVAGPELSGTAEQQPSPYDIVETFFWENAEHFEAAEQLWAVIRTKQRELKEDMPDLNESLQDAASNLHEHLGVAVKSINLRASRREFHKQSEQMNHYQFQTANHIASVFYRDTIASHISELTPEEIEDCVQTHYEHALNDPDTEMGLLPVVAPTDEASPFDTELTATFSTDYLRAFIAQGQNAARIDALLADPQNVLPFIERVTELAANAKIGIMEYPGLLETLALVAKQDNGKHIKESIRATLHPQTVYKEIIGSVLYEQSISAATAGKRRELTGVAVGMQLVARAVAADGLSKEDLVTRLAGIFEAWPAELSSIANGRLQSETEAIWQSLKEAVKPFEHSGRFFAEKNDYLERFVNRLAHLNGTKRHIMDGFTPDHGAKKRKKNQSKKRDPQARPFNPEDITSQETEKIPPRFATLKKLGDNRYTMEVVGASIEDVMSLPIVQDFVNKHSEPRLADNVQAFIEGLADIRYDKRHCSPVRDSNRYYHLDAKNVSNTRRSLYYFNPKQFATGGKGPLASRTRIRYGLVNIQDVPHILLQDILLATSG